MLHFRNSWGDKSRTKSLKKHFLFFFKASGLYFIAESSDLQNAQFHIIENKCYTSFAKNWPHSTSTCLSTASNSMNTVDTTNVLPNELKYVISSCTLSLLESCLYSKTLMWEHYFLPIISRWLPFSCAKVSTAQSYKTVST